MKLSITRREFAHMLAAAALAGGRLARADRPPLRMAISMDTLANSDLTDARAAYRIWSDQVIAALCHHRAVVLPDIFYTSTQMLEMIRTQQVECCILTAREFTRVQELMDPDQLMLEDYAANGLEYLLLVHQTSPYQKLEDLKHSHLMVHEHRDTVLVRPWLELELAGLRQPAMEQFFDGVELRRKVTEVLLPVFFRKAPAVTICRRSFNLAVELNPQLGRDLRVLATSPRVVPIALWFRKGSDAGDRQEVMHTMTILNQAPAGRQILALYESSGFVVRSGSLMAGTLDLLRQFDRLKR